nr:GtrA family protein [Kutzneria sp. CA-103260]
MPTQTNPPQTRAERFGSWLTGWATKLPPRLRFITPELVGFVILGTFTFAIDLSILAVLRAWAPDLPLWVPLTIGYSCAFGINYVLNRTMNFKSHAPIGGQALRFIVLTLADLGLTSLITTWLDHAGLPLLLARIGAAACVGLFTYVGARFWVFRKEPVQD